MSDLLIDTHIWLWYTEGMADTLSTDTLMQMEEARNERRLHVSVVSVWEIGRLLAKKCIALSAPLQDWVGRGRVLPGLRLRALTTEVVIESTLLPGDLLTDPADRFLIGEARVAGLTLVTADRKIIDYGRVGHVRVLGG